MPRRNTRQQTADGAYGGDYDDIYDPYYIDEPYYPVVQARAGLLTGGEWRDNDNFSFWRSLFGQREDWKSVSENWSIDTLSRIAVNVTGDGSGLSGCTVKLMGGSEVLWTAVTDSRGDAYLFPGITKEEAPQPEKIIVERNGKTAAEKELDPGFRQNGNEKLTIDISGEKNVPKLSLDLMFMIDTTGSMDDELSYIQKELEDVIKRVAETTNVSIDLSVNFYRDYGDDYVVRSFEFDSDIQKVLKILAEQEADGGGDFPEAVPDALDNAVNSHQWRKDSEKLMFFVLDAPPHMSDAAKLPSLIKKAAEKGIHIIPVVSSGSDTDTEFLCRSMAVATGGTYTFLTDDSGIGGSHLEPTVGKYSVEKLNDMIVRIIADYFSVEAREPQQLPDRGTQSAYRTAYSITSGYYSKDMYTTVYIADRNDLDEFFESYGRIDKLADFAEGMDFDKNIIAVKVVSSG